MVNATIMLGVALILGDAIVSLSGIGVLIGLPMILLGILLIALRARLSTLWSLLTPNS